jgi:DNA-binding NarL/FixJ family response regulator
MATDARFATLLVEDEPATRSYLAAAVALIVGAAPVHAVGTFVEGREALERCVPRLLLADLGLPDGSGLNLIRAASVLTPRPDILVISALGDEAHVIAALEAGANGYLLKDASEAAVVAGIMEVLAGGAPISPSIAVHVLRRLRSRTASTGVGAAADREVELTQREIDVLSLAAKGLTHDEIAVALQLKYSTVISYVREVYRKLDVHSRSEALYEARQIGLLREDV